MCRGWASSPLPAPHPTPPTPTPPHNTHTLPDGVLTYDGANLVEGIIKQVLRGEDPYTKAPCGDLGAKGFQVGLPPRATRTEGGARA